VGLELMPDGRIVVCGRSADDLARRNGVALMRLTPAGRFDPSFGGTGRLVAQLFSAWDVVRNIALDAEGRVLLLDEQSRGIAVARFGADGLVDHSFGRRGVRAMALNPAEGDGETQAGRLTVQADGKIIAVAVANFNSEMTRPVLDAVRLTAAGEADGTF